MQRMMPVVAALLVAAPLAAQEAQQPQSAMNVTTAVIATGVQDREPVGVGDQFPADVGQVYFYTVFEGDFPETNVAHVWYRNGEEVSRVELRVKGPRWRTWSSKTISPEWTGEWTARVVDAEGNVLAEATFTVGTM